MKRRLLHFVRCFKIWAVLRWRTSSHIFPWCTQEQYFLKSGLEPVGWTGERATLDNGETSWKETENSSNNVEKIEFSSSCDLESGPPTSLSQTSSGITADIFFILWRNLPRRRFPPLALLPFNLGGAWNGTLCMLMLIYRPIAPPKTFCKPVSAALEKPCRFNPEHQARLKRSLTCLGPCFRRRPPPQPSEPFTVTAQSLKSTFPINAALLLPPRCTPP